MNGMPSHVNVTFEGLAKQRTELFFPRDVSSVKSRDELDRPGKVEFLSKFGLSAWEKLPQKSAGDRPVELAPDRLTGKQFQALDRTTKAQLCGEWGPDAIGAIMARR